jgi:hypothetical protein
MKVQYKRLAFALGLPFAFVFFLDAGYGSGAGVMAYVPLGANLAGSCLKVEDTGLWRGLLFRAGACVSTKTLSNLLSGR